MTHVAAFTLWKLDLVQKVTVLGSALVTTIYYKQFMFDSTLYSNNICFHRTSLYRVRWVGPAVNSTVHVTFYSSRGRYTFLNS